MCAIKQHRAESFRRTTIVVASFAMWLALAPDCTSHPPNSENTGENPPSLSCDTQTSCPTGFRCSDENRCVPSSDSSPKQADAGGSDADTANEVGDTSWTRDAAVTAAADTLCTRLIGCYGEDYIQMTDCVQELKIGSDSDGCTTYHAEQADACLSCLEKNIHCEEIRGLTLLGYPLSTYCPECDLMCSKP